ncbi:hypothetical protein CsSME_00039739 [Camellia sinensis var. sinensis]
MWNLTAALCLIWAATLLYGDMFTFWVPFLWSCSWPHLRHRSLMGLAGNCIVVLDSRWLIL